MLRRALRATVYVGSFGLGRGALFAAPLILANVLSPAEYGTLEFVQAAASVGAPFIALGTAGVVPLVLVRKVSRGSWPAVLAHHVVCTTGLLLLAGMLYLLKREFTPLLLALAVGALMLQSLWSVTLKSSGYGEASLLLDTGFWGTLALATGVAYLLAVPIGDRWNWVFAALVSYVALLFGWTASALGRTVNQPWEYPETLKMGLPLMISGFLSLLATTSGRLGIGMLATPELTADYAVLFRATALPIVAHQLLMVGGFRKVFAAPEAELQRRLPIVVAAVATCVIAFWAFAPFAGVAFGQAFAAALVRHQTEGLLILAQCILWSAIALNDLVNTRKQLAGSIAGATAVYLLFALPTAVLFVSRGALTLEVYVPLHSFLMAGYFLTQVIFMWRHGVRLVATWAMAFGSFIALSAAIRF